MLNVTLNIINSIRQVLIYIVHKTFIRLRIIYILFLETLSYQNKDDILVDTLWKRNHNKAYTM